MKTLNPWLEPVNSLRKLGAVLLEACALLLATAYFVAFWYCVSIFLN